MKTITFDETKFVLVPVEPTRAMLEAGWAVNVIKAHDTGEYHHVGSGSAYRAMIASHPTVKEGLTVPAVEQSSIVLDVDALSNEIRRVDGNHSLGAGALAEALMPFLRAGLGSSQDHAPTADAAAETRPQNVTVGRELLEQAVRYFTIDMGHDSYVNLKFNYGERYFDVGHAIVKDLEKALSRPSPDTANPTSDEPKPVAWLVRGQNGTYEVFADWDSELADVRALLTGRKPEPLFTRSPEATGDKSRDEPEPVGTASTMAGSNGGFTMAAFKAEDVPVGTKLFTSPPSNKDLVEALKEAIDVFEGMMCDEINEELLPRLRAALNAGGGL